MSEIIYQSKHSGKKIDDNIDLVDAHSLLLEQKADKVNVTTTNAYQFINVPANTDFNTLTTKGVYTWLDTVGFTNAPSDIPRYGKMIVSDNVHNGSSCLQEIIGYNPTTKKVIKITRSKMNDTTYSWSSWSTEATTDKIDILITPASGMTKVYDNSYKINNVVFLNFGVKKTDDTAFATNAQVLIGTVPSGSTPITNPSSGSIQGLTSASAGIGIGNLSVLSGGQIYATMSTSNITTLRVSEVHICS